MVASEPVLTYLGYSSAAGFEISRNHAYRVGRKAGFWFRR